MALRALRGGADDDTREVVDRTLAKLEAAAGDGARRRRRWSTPGATTAPDADPPARLARGRRRRRPAGAARPTTCPPATRSPSASSTRAAWSPPHGVAYLDAWCHSAEAPRLFRLDRIHEAEVLDTPVETTAEAPRDLSDGLFQRSPGRPRLVTLGCSRQARWVAEYYPVEEVRPVADGDGSRSTCSSPTSGGCSGCCCGWRRTHGGRPPELADDVHGRRHSEALSLYASRRRTDRDSTSHNTT